MGAKRSSRLLVLYGSQTGTAQDAADRVGREAARRGCPAVDVLSVDEFDARWLPGEEYVIFVVSTTGQGEMPDSMKEFWKFLLQKNISNNWLEHVHYAVFGLGDSAYQKYNFAAKKLDRRLQNIGGKPLILKGLGDDQHRSGYESAFDPWLSSLWNTLHEKDLMLLPRTVDDLDASSRHLDPPKFKVIFHSINETIHGVSSTFSDLNSLKNLVNEIRSMSLGKSHYKRPQYLLQMVTNLLLTEPGVDAAVHHLEFECSSEDLSYKVGDVLEVLPAQDPDSVTAFIHRANLDPDSFITVHPNINGKDHDSSIMPVRLRTFVEFVMDVTSASPCRYFFEVMSFFASAEHEKEKLQYFASSEGRDDLYQYNHKERRTVLEVLEDFPSVHLPFEWLVQLCPPLKTRAFSISSSPLVHPEKINLTVKALTFTTPFKRKRSGLCSTWLTKLNPSQRVYIPAWIHGGGLPTPLPQVPLILVGPGTGCAPFHGFIEELAASDTTIPPVLFFFGCRNKDKDFLYRDFWLTHSKKGGVLSPERGGGFFVAFSRDQPYKVYVQDKMKEEREKVWQFLRGGSSAVYIAGSAAKMPADVVAALEEIVAEKAGLEREVAQRWLKERGIEIFIEAWS